MLHSDQEKKFFAVSASVMAVLEAEERVELAVGSDSGESGEAVVKTGHLELDAMCFGLAAKSVEGQGQLEVLERLDWTALVIQPSKSGMPLIGDERVEASAGY